MLKPMCHWLALPTDFNMTIEHDIMYGINRLILICLFICVMGAVHAQSVKSETATFFLNNEPVEDTVPPEVRILAPFIEAGKHFHTTKGEIDLDMKVTDDSKISYVRVNREVPIIDDKGGIFVTLKLNPGENKLKIRAIDVNENIFDQTYIIEYEPPVVTLADRIHSESTYYGLLIGINEYEDERMKDLDNPLADASALQRVLIRDYIFDEENVLLIRNPGRNDIIYALDQLRDKVTPNDNLLIFYAGHGYYDKEAEIGYWLPSDASKSSPANWYENSTLVNQLRGIHSKHTLLITDACFGGSILKSRAVDMHREIAYDRIYTQPSRKAMTSGNMSEVPDESEFVKYLIKRLKENRAIYYSAGELFRDLQIAVTANSPALPQYGDIQNVGSEGGDFIFLRKE